MTDFDFLRTNRKTRATAGRAIASLESAGYTTLASTIEAGHDAVTKLPYVSERAWAVMMAEAEMRVEAAGVRRQVERFAPGPLAVGAAAGAEAGGLLFDGLREHRLLASRLNHVIRYLRGQCSDLPEVE